MTWLEKVAWHTLIIYLLLKAVKTLSVIQVFAMVLMPKTYEVSMLPFIWFFVAHCSELYTIMILRKAGVTDELKGDD
jgi:hypothetical protein